MSGPAPVTALPDYLLTAEELERLPHEDQERYLRILRTLVGGESFTDFVARLKPQEPVPPHGRALADIFRRARLRMSLTMLSWPPGFAKTTLAVRGLAWWLARSPSDPCGFITYSDAKAYRHSDEVRTLVRKSGIAMNPSQQGKGDWATSHGGGLFAGGWRGKGTGYRVAGFLMVDDPYRRIEDALSESYRNGFANWLRSVATTRLQGGSIVCSHTRWSDLDAIGEFGGTGNWRVINLAAIAEEGDPLGRQPGESLWPEQFPAISCTAPCGHAGHLDRIREDAGEWTWAALYQGRPTPMSGGDFKPSWWQFTHELEPGQTVRAWDLAGTEGGQGAATCGVLMTRTPIGEYFVHSPFWARLSPGGVTAAIRAFAEMDGRGVFISLPCDPGQAGLAQKADFAKLLDGWTFECTPEGQGHTEGGPSKRGRARPYAAQVENGNVFLVHGAGWTATYHGGRLQLQAMANWHPEWVAEHAAFPFGALADRVDASSRGYHALNKTVIHDVAASPKIYTREAT